MARLLEINLQPENKYYRYDFLYDNCATRIRDIIEKATKGHTSFENFTVEEDRTFRDLIAPYMSHKKWSKFGTDLGLGMPVDKVADPYEYMFLPYWLMKGFAEGEFGDHDLVKEKKILYEAEEKEQKDDYWISPKLAFWLLLIVAFFSLFSKRFSKIFDVSFFFILGLIGLLVLSLWLFSDHETTHNNLNILWALPTHVVFCWFLIGHRHSKITHKYFGFTLLVATLTLIFWRVIPQDFNGAVIPLLIIIIIKSLSIVRSKKE